MICRIVGDENDGDMQTSTFVYDSSLPVSLQGGIALEENAVYPGSRAISKMELTQALIEAIKLPRETRHNWSRTEYDTKHAANETITWVIRILFNIDIEDEEVYNDTIFPADSWPEEVCERLFDEFMMELLPYGDCGIHTIVRVEVYPRTSVVKLYEDRRSYPDKVEYKKAQSQVNLIVTNESTGELVQLKDTSLNIYKLMENGDFVLLAPCHVGKVFWKKGE